MPKEQSDIALEDDDSDDVPGGEEEEDAAELAELGEEAENEEEEEPEAEDDDVRAIADGDDDGDEPRAGSRLAARFKELTDQKKAADLERQRLLGLLEKGQPQPKPKVDDFNEDKLLEERSEAQLAGDHKKVKEIDKAIRAHDRMEIQAEANATARQTVAAETVSDVIARSAAKYPMLLPNLDDGSPNPDYDVAFFGTVMAQRDHEFEKGGVTLAQAIEKAVEFAAKRFKLDDDDAEGDAAETARLAAVKRNARRALSQAPPIGKAGTGAGAEIPKAVEAATATQEAWNNLSQKERDAILEGRATPRQRLRSVAK